MSPDASQDKEQVVREAHAEYERRDARSAQFDESRRAADSAIRRRTAQSYECALRATGMLPMGGTAVVDIGCGDGDFLFRCRDDWGQQDAPLAGIDLMENRIEALNQNAPFLDARAGSADKLPWDDASFDLAHQSMLFSSVLDEALRQTIAAEMRRIIKPGGRVLWYDFIWNPTNKATVGMPLSLVCSYFPGWSIDYRRRITLAPPLARPLSRVSEALVRMLEACKILNFFELVLLRKPSTPESES